MTIDWSRVGQAALNAVLWPFLDHRKWKRRIAGQAIQRRNSRLRREGCPCGQPATHVIRDQDEATGIMWEWWYCEEHRGAVAWSRLNNGPAYNFRYERSSPCEACVGRCGGGGPIGGPRTRWHCPTRPGHEPQRPGSLG